MPCCSEGHLASMAGNKLGWDKVTIFLAMRLYRVTVEPRKTILITLGTDEVKKLGRVDARGAV